MKRSKAKGATARRSVPAFLRDSVEATEDDLRDAARLDKMGQPVTASEFGRRHGMTTGRALNALTRLYDLGLASFEYEGNRRYWARTMRAGGAA